MVEDGARQASLFHHCQLKKEVPIVPLGGREFPRCEEFVA
jgi:hypothetical protein